MSERIRLGIVGGGVATQVIHLPVIRRRPDLFEVVAVCDPLPNARHAVGDRAAVVASRRFESIEELLSAGQLDAVLVLSSGSHGRLCALAAAAGLPVFCEKPLAYTSAEADALAAASARIAVGYMKVYDPAVRRGAEILASHTLRSIEVTVLHPPAATQLAGLQLAQSHDIAAERRTALEDEEQQTLEAALGPASSAVRDLYRWKILGSIVHDLAVVRVLAGEVAAWDWVRAWPSDSLESVALEGTLADGTRLCIHWHFLSGFPIYREDIRVYHEGGAVQMTFPSPYVRAPEGTLTVVDHDRGSPRTSRCAFTASPFEEELVAFHRLVTDGVATDAGITEGRSDIVTCQRALRLYCEQHDLPIGGEALLA